MKNEAQELLMEWAGLTKEFYRVTDLEEDTFDNAISLMERVGQLKDTLYIEHGVGSFFLYGAEDMYLGDASGVPAPMDTFLAEELFDYISKGAKVSDVYEGERKEYLEGAEWWHSTSKGEEV